MQLERSITMHRIQDIQNLFIGKGLTFDISVGNMPCISFCIVVHIIEVDEQERAAQPVNLD
jgi:hypothetical protein